MATGPGHGALIYITVDPESGGTFTVVPGLNTDLNLKVGARAWENTPHNAVNYDTHERGQLLRPAMPFSVNYDAANAVHQALDGFAFSGETFGLRFVGAGGSAGVDEIIESGFITDRDAPNTPREGQRMVTYTFQGSGDYLVDGVLVSTL